MSVTKEKNKNGSVVVVGGGIAGVQLSSDLADSGYYVYLVEKTPSIGGIMSQLDKTFPTNDCSMCILAPKLVGVGRNPNIELLTHSEVKEFAGKPGNFKVKVVKHARSVDPDKCTGCGLCTENCPIQYKIQPKEEALQIPEIEDREEIDKIINSYKDLDSPVVQILLDINEKYKYLPEPVLKYISYKMDIPFSEIYRMVTFYKAFSLEPKGKYHFKVCMGTACHVRGAEAVLESIKHGIKDTKKDLFSVETVNCLGVCASGPVIVVNETYYGNMNSKNTAELVKKLIDKENE
ncbi:MAG: NAD(P)H-dependent oxidoreductase subunit E [Victivallales bacterium]|nr:NAD(P)H-dependent oxidoreductase subunit E [Victivallales bacterium]MCF7888859.1 NAD(P)H-dependent oxidoreductase subunit E [Victivallales bacterium]